MHPNVFCCLPIVTAILMGSAAAFVSSQSDKVMGTVSTDSSTNASAIPKVTPDVIGVFLQVQEVLLRLVETLQGVVTHLMSGLTGGDPSSTTNRLDTGSTLDVDLLNSNPRSNTSISLEENSPTYMISDVLTPNASGLHSNGNGIALERRDEFDIDAGDVFSKNNKGK
uniref:Uncharacterized protein n=1 Tax=Cacopsylla melanoneura TaxID=428564 RepID=A0A8D9AX40_9HEMI